MTEGRFSDVGHPRFGLAQVPLLSPTIRRVQNIRSMCHRGRSGLWITALRCLPLSVAWVVGTSFKSSHRPGDKAGSLTASTRLSMAACEAPSQNPKRTYQTPVDEFFQTFGELPLPRKVHVVLPVADTSDEQRRGVLVIGDVHGCYEELMELHEKAVERNDGIAFRYVILVGDMVNKGPHSTKVLRHVQSSASQGWMAVRGNHDNSALKAALGDATRRNKTKYAWIFDESDPIRDSDVVWMAELPYTIRIPGSTLQRTEDVVVVHAGFVPGKSVDAQAPSDMVTLREVHLQKANIDSQVYYSRANSTSADQNRPWASVWRGKEFVIFGHDAARGLQDYEYALGLDTGACYGKMLTGIILPQGRLVHVHSTRVYCEIDKADE